MSTTNHQSDVGDQPDGADLITAERRRHTAVEGWTHVHDAEWAGGELAQAAACYAMPTRTLWLKHAWGYPTAWPWSRDRWKPTPDDRIRELVKAGALCAAEIDRLLAEESR